MLQPPHFCLFFFLPLLHFFLLLLLLLFFLLLLLLCNIKQKSNPTDTSYSKTQNGTVEGTKNKNKITMICTWIFELMLHRIVSLELSVFIQEPNTDMDKNVITNTNTNTNAVTNPLTSTASTKNLPLKLSPSSEEKFCLAKETNRLSQVSNIKDFLRKHKYVLIFVPSLCILNLHHKRIL